tara:strand:- start:805 stop:993 length:189 start_codon:yes stop_codon:yes gene_type:complete
LQKLLCRWSQRYQGKKNAANPECGSDRVQALREQIHLKLLGNIAEKDSIVDGQSLDNALQET